jgi:hypothetical protein
MAVGYENPIAACMLMVVGLIIKSKQSPNDRGLVIRVIGVGAFSALATFMQPRWILTTIVVAVIWALMYKSRKVQALILVGVIGVMALAPAILIQRNIVSIDKPIISTNISAALRIGTGPETTGGYKKTGPDIKCESKTPGEQPTDGEYLSCALKWYTSNPVKTAQLTWYKSLYFWSPWSGPSANGTMARNPWLKINPIVDIGKNSQDGNDLVYGLAGKVISWLWILANLSLLFYGFWRLRKMGEIYSNLSYLLMGPILASWIAAVGTIGDHRFRIPTMSLSLVLQVVGFIAIRNKVLKK